jgi:hypothetical protein
MMTPKEKAKELVEKYAIWSWNETVCDYEVAKQCALIAVDEILNCLFEIDNSYYWWQEVKEEIENL